MSGSDAVTFTSLNLLAAHGLDQVKELTFAVGIDAPVDGDELVAVDVVTVGGVVGSAFAGVKIAPARVAAYRRDHVVVRLVKVKVVVFIEDDGLAAIAGQRAGAVDLIGDERGIAGEVAVQEEKVGHPGDRVVGDAAASSSRRSSWA